jgi:hypothetical protein
MACPRSGATGGKCPMGFKAATANAAAAPTIMKKANIDALRSEIRVALVNDKANACPIASRLVRSGVFFWCWEAKGNKTPSFRQAWHAAGTFDATDGSGGCDGARIRFEPEASDPANAGLSIIRDLV